jgi:hypothetical protein
MQFCAWRCCDGPKSQRVAWSLLLFPQRGHDPPPLLQPDNEEERVDMRIYDIEFDIDSFLDEMEEVQRARRQRQQQIHRSADVIGSMSDGPRDRDPD